MKITKDYIDKIFSRFFLISFIGLIVLNISLQNIITSMDGDAKLINSLGLIRGSSQKITKQEFFGEHEDEPLQFIDDSIEEVLYDNGKDKLNTFNDKDYIEKASELSDKWIVMKNTIYNYRKTNDKNELYIASEDFFKCADELVSISENLSQKKVNTVLNLKLIFFTFTFITIITFFIQMYFSHTLRKDVQNLVNLAKKDKLTGLPNRRACDEQIEKYSNMKISNNLCCISIDLDNLKQLNDNYGHFVGDRLITLFGNALLEETKKDMFSCRNGGDEFMIFIENCDMQKAKNFISELDRNISIKNSKEKLVKISYSYGISLYSEDPNYTIIALMETADKRMYEYKALKKHNELRG